MALLPGLRPRLDKRPALRVDHRWGRVRHVPVGGWWRGPRFATDAGAGDGPAVRRCRRDRAHLRRPHAADGLPAVDPVRLRRVKRHRRDRGPRPPPVGDVGDPAGTRPAFGEPCRVGGDPRRPTARRFRRLVVAGAPAGCTRHGVRCRDRGPVLRDDPDHVHGRRHGLRMEQARPRCSSGRRRSCSGTFCSTRTTPISMRFARPA